MANVAEGNGVWFGHHLLAMTFPLHQTLLRPLYNAHRLRRQVTLKSSVASMIRAKISDGQATVLAEYPGRLKKR